MCQPGDEAIYRSLFKNPVSMGNFHRLTPEQQQKAKQMQAQMLYKKKNLFYSRGAEGEANADTDSGKSVYSEFL